MTIKQLIEQYRTQYDSLSPKFDTLENIDVELNKGISLEQKVALRQIRGEVIGVLYNEILTQWLVENSIPENDWINYSYDGEQIIYNG